MRFSRPLKREANAPGLGGSRLKHRFRWCCLRSQASPWRKSRNSWKLYRRRLDSHFPSDLTNGDMVQSKAGALFCESQMVFLVPPFISYSHATMQTRHSSFPSRLACISRSRQFGQPSSKNWPWQCAMAAGKALEATVFFFEILGPVLIRLLYGACKAKQRKDKRSTIILSWFGRRNLVVLPWKTLPTLLMISRHLRRENGQVGSKDATTTSLDAIVTDDANMYKNTTWYNSILRMVWHNMIWCIVFVCVTT